MPKYRPPLYVMCGCCGELISGSPSAFPMVPRFCGGKVENPDYIPQGEGQIKWLPCMATSVITGKGGKVGVRWNKRWYEVYGQGLDRPIIEYADGKKQEVTGTAPVREVTVDEAVEGHLDDLFGGDND